MGTTKTFEANRVLTFVKDFVGFKSKFEAKKFASIAITKFLTVYIFHVLRGLEYSIVVPRLGAEVISAVELCCLLPASSLFVVLYFKLGKHFSRITIATIFLIFFVIFFLFFNIFLFPSHDNIVLDFSIYKDAYPRLKYLILLIENWHITLFYVFAELWGIMMLSLSFWQLANEVSTVSEAKKYYGFFGAIGQSGLIVAGWAAVKFGEKYSGSSDEVWNMKFYGLMITTLICAILLLLSYWWIAKNIWRYVRIEERRYAKVKLTISESFKYILASRYLMFIATLIVCYGVLMFISETIWKDQAGKIYTNSSDYSSFLGVFQIYMGYGTVAGMLFAVISLRYFSWIFNALATPVSFLLFGSMFFLLIIFKNEFCKFFAEYDFSVVSIALTMGMLQILLAKSFKYSLFDLSKEMLYIPLDEELRTNGKAAVDIISQRVGRSGGSVVTLGLLTIMPDATISSLAPFLFVVLVFMGWLWIYATIALNEEFKKISKTEKNFD